LDENCVRVWILLEMAQEKVELRLIGDAASALREAVSALNLLASMESCYSYS